MNQVFEFLFSQYSGYSNLNIAIEVIAIVFSVFSVLYSLKNKVWVFPTGIISTLLFVYLLFKWGLLGDMIVNVYYFVMSIYGWYFWTKKVDETHVTPISYTTKREHITTLFIFITHINIAWNQIIKLPFIIYYFFLGCNLFVSRFVKIFSWFILIKICKCNVNSVYSN